jgi:hypothetical protein
MTRHAECSRYDSALFFVGCVLNCVHLKRRKDLLQFIFVKTPTNVCLAAFAETTKDAGFF